MNKARTRKPILSGLRVLDIGHQYAAANCCAILADLGAEVLQVEHPGGSPIRAMLPKKGAQSLWWKVVERGKKHITLDLSQPRGREMLLALAQDHDVIVENFRPGTLEKWKLGPQDLERAGLNLTMVRISGFGQTGPYSPRPGYGSVAEAMSGFAHMTGFPDGPPVFPSASLADGVASLWAVIGTLASMYGNGRQPQGVEVVDVALLEGLLRIVPTQVAACQQMGLVQTRPGNYLGDHGSLRNVYRTRDGKWFIVAATGPTVRHILVGVDARDLVADFDTGVTAREDQEAIADFLKRCDAFIAQWSTQRDWGQVTAALGAAGAVHAPVYSAADILEDPHLKARGALVTLPDEDLGEITMQGIVPRFPGRDHAVSHGGRRRGADNEAFYAARGFSADDLAAMKKDGLI